jgi:hypothetical protein
VIRAHCWSTTEPDRAAAGAPGDCFRARVVEED